MPEKPQKPSNSLPASDRDAGHAPGHWLLARVGKKVLRPGGRLVVNTVTVEGEAALVAFRAAHGGALRRIGIERVAPVGRFGGWRALAGVTQLVARKDS